MKLFFITLCIAFSAVCSAQQYSEELLAAKMDLDSAWFSVQRPTEKVCLPASAFEMRGSAMSDHACMEKAIKEASATGPDAAMPWLLAAFCYDQPAQDRVSKAGKDAIRYIMNQWGGGEANIAGAEPAVAPDEPVVHRVKIVNKTGEWLYLYALMTDVPDGKGDCKDYVYVGKLVQNRAHNQVIAKGRYLWMRVKSTKDADGCGEFLKEYKLGAKPDQTLSSTEDIIVE